MIKKRFSRITAPGAIRLAKSKRRIRRLSIKPLFGRRHCTTESQNVSGLRTFFANCLKPLVLWRSVVHLKTNHRAPEHQRNLVAAMLGRNPQKDLRRFAAIKPVSVRASLPPEIEIEQRWHRLSFLKYAFAFIGLLVLFRLFSLQSLQHEMWVNLAAKQHGTKIEVLGARGSLLDREGRALAVSVQTFALGAHLKKINEIKETSGKLAQFLGLKPSEVEKKLKQEKSFIWLARGVPTERIKELNSLGVAGLSTFDEFRRYYPQGTLAGALLGRVNRDGLGLSGLELQFNNKLSADAYQLAVRRDARGNLLKSPIENTLPRVELFKSSLSSVFSSALVSNAFSDDRRVGYHLSVAQSLDYSSQGVRFEGNDITLSIDAVVQQIVESELDRSQLESKAKRVFALLLNADTGEILSLAQSPGFDPNRFKDVSPADLRNVVIQDNFEPGSTLKPIVAAAALDQGLVKDSEMMHCGNGRYKVGKFTVRDVHPVGAASFADVLIRSSNVCMAKIGQRMGKEGLFQALSDFGFGHLTGIELPGEEQGILRDHSRWAQIDVATHSFGQGISVTALQLVQSYAVLANGGRLVRPTLIRRDRLQNIPSYQVISPKAAKTISEILQSVTEDEHGTGTKSRIAGLAVHGKTGTAQKARLNGRGYDPDRILASFIGYVDGNEIGVNAKLVMLVAVDEPQVRPRWGGVLAAPVFKRSMERVFSYLLTSGGANVQTVQLRGISNRGKST